MNKKTFLLVIALFVAGQLLVAKVDPATLNLGDNLLENPGFEDPKDGSVITVTESGANSGNEIEGWTILSSDWIRAYYPGDGTNNPQIIRTGPVADPSWWSSNAYYFDDYIEGSSVLRISGGQAGGFYQVVEVIPGETYFISIDVFFSKGNTNQSIRTDESLKITYNFNPGDPGDPGVSFSDDVVIHEEPIPFVAESEDPQQQICEGVCGTFTVPEDVTEVRFLLDKRNQFGTPTTRPSGLYLYDNCKFQKVIKDDVGIRKITGDDPVVSTCCYTVEGVKIANPPAENGIYIVRKTLQSGKVVVEKKIKN